MFLPVFCPWLPCCVAVTQPACSNLELSEGFLHVVRAATDTVDIHAALAKAAKIICGCKRTLEVNLIEIPQHVTGIVYVTGIN